MRMTLQLSPGDSQARSIAHSDLCRVFNDRGETSGYGLVMNGLMPGVLGAQNPPQGTRLPNAREVNWLATQDAADIGRRRLFYSALAQIGMAPVVAGIRVQGSPFRATANC
jgi:anaerobic selenocysteine-containing dehydrogenase